MPFGHGKFSKYKFDNDYKNGNYSPSRFVTRDIFAIIESLIKQFGRQTPSSKEILIHDYPHLSPHLSRKIKMDFFHVWKMEIIPVLARSTAMLSVPQGITCMIN